MIMMIAGAFDLHWLAVEEESLVGVPRDCAHAEAYARSVTRLPSGFHRHPGGIHVWRLRRPEGGSRDRGTGHETCRPVGTHGLRWRVRRSHYFSCCVQNLPAYPATLRPLPLVLHHS